MDNPKLFRIAVSLWAPLLVFSMHSCTDITNLSTGELREHISRLDGQCSNWLNSSRQPLSLINNKVVSVDLLNRINPEHIDSISLLKCDEAIKIYGNDAKYGAVQIFAHEKIFTDLKNESIINSERN